MIYGTEAVETFERIKAFYTRYGNALEHEFAAAVDGRVGGNGEPDVISRLGEFEFCSQANTKNAAGEAAQRARGVVVVQVEGTPRQGRISGVDFLKKHGIKNARRAVGDCETAAARAAAMPT